VSADLVEVGGHDLVHEGEPQSAVLGDLPTEELEFVMSAQDKRYGVDGHHTEEATQKSELGRSAGLRPSEIEWSIV
jgi:hypothetical protein